MARLTPELRERIRKAREIRERDHTAKRTSLQRKIKRIEEDVPTSLDDPREVRDSLY